MSPKADSLILSIDSGSSINTGSIVNMTSRIEYDSCFESNTLPSTQNETATRNIRSDHQRSNTATARFVPSTVASSSSHLKSPKAKTFPAPSSSTLSTKSHDGNNGVKTNISNRFTRIRNVFRSTNPIVGGILLYLVCFQFTATYYYHHSNQNEKSVDDSHRYITASSTRREARLLLQNASVPTQSFGCSNLNRSPYRPMIPPPEQEPEPVPWVIKSDVQLTKLTYPIFMTSMPKSGTTSLWKFFQCGNQKSSHNWIKKRSSSKSTLSGQCIKDNINVGKPPFHDCGDFDVYTDTGVSIIYIFFIQNLF